MDIHSQPVWIIQFFGNNTKWFNWKYPSIDFHVCNKFSERKNTFQKNVSKHFLSAEASKNRFCFVDFGFNNRFFRQPLKTSLSCHLESIFYNVCLQSSSLEPSCCGLRCCSAAVVHCGGGLKPLTKKLFSSFEHNGQNLTMKNHQTRISSTKPHN